MESKSVEGSKGKTLERFHSLLKSIMAPPRRLCGGWPRKKFFYGYIAGIAGAYVSRESIYRKLKAPASSVEVLQLKSFLVATKPAYR